MENGCDINRLFREMLRRHRSAHHKIVEKLGLYYGQPLMLMMLFDNGEMSQKELSDRLKNTPASVAVSVKRMEKAGLIIKQPDPNDLRLNKISLTDRGCELALECRKNFYHLDSEMVRGFTSEELCMLENFYERMIYNLENLDNSK